MMQKILNVVRIVTFVYFVKIVLWCVRISFFHMCKVVLTKYCQTSIHKHRLPAGLTLHVAYIICSIWWLLPVTHPIQTHGGRNYLIWKMNTLHISWLLSFWSVPAVRALILTKHLSVHILREVQCVSGQCVYWLSLNIIKGHIIGYIKY